MPRLRWGSGRYNSQSYSPVESSRSYTPTWAPRNHQEAWRTSERQSSSPAAPKPIRLPRGEQLLRLQRPSESLSVVGVSFLFSSLLGFINHVFTGVDKHHHHHSPRKRVVGCNLTLIVGVPHKREACFATRAVGDRSRRGRRSACAAGGRAVHTRAGASRGARGRIRTQIGASAIPCAIDHDVGVRQGSWTACRHVPDGRYLERFVVVLAPLEVV